MAGKNEKEGKKRFAFVIGKGVKPGNKNPLYYIGVWVKYLKDGVNGNIDNEKIRKGLTNSLDKVMERLKKANVGDSLEISEINKTIGLIEKDIAKALDMQRLLGKGLSETHLKK